MGILFNCIASIPHHITSDIDHSITFQILHDTLNVVSDSIIVTDRDMRIVYKNESFVSMIKKYYNPCLDANIHSNPEPPSPHNKSLHGMVS